jgi:aerobic-type carbon monoxide dehydrogenase small subunit (CoxS/CutS family)
MAAVALLGHREDPDDAAIARAMAGRLCRHDTYPQIRKAIKRAAEARKAARSPGPGASGQPDSPAS